MTQIRPIVGAALLLIIPTAAQGQSFAFDLTSEPFASSPSIRHHTATVGNGFALIGNWQTSGSLPLIDGWVGQFSVSGQLQWANNYTTEWERTLFTTADVAQNGDLIIGGGVRNVFGRQPGLLARLNPDGSPLWFKAIDGETVTTVQDVFETADGGIAALALSLRSGPQVGVAILAKFAADGDPLWQRALPAVYDHGTVAFAESANGVLGVMAFGDAGPMTVVAFDPGGGVLWKTEVPGAFPGLEYPGLIAPDGNGGFLVAADHSPGPPSFLHFGADGDLIADVAFELEESNGFGSAQVSGLTANVDGGWTAAMGAPIAVKMMLRLDDALNDTWAREYESPFFAQVSELHGQEAFGPNYLATGPGAGGRTVMLVNEFGNIQDPECTLLTPLSLQKTSRGLTAGAGAIEVSESQLTVRRIDVEVSDAKPIVDWKCEQDLTPGDETNGGVDLRIPVAICFQRTELIFPGNPVGDPVFDALRCNFDPRCPDCLRSLDDGSPLPNPPWRAALYDTARQLIDSPDAPASPSDIEAALQAVENVPAGRHFTDRHREALAEALKQLHAIRTDHPRGRVPEGTDVRAVFTQALNLVDLDLTAPASLAPTVRNEDVLRFGRLAALERRGPVASDLGDVRLELIGEGPGYVRNMLPGWPALAFEFRGAERVRSGSVDVEIYYGGMRFRGSHRNIRLFQVTDNGLRDVTYSIDLSRSVITGRTDRPGKFVIMERVPERR